MSINELSMREATLYATTKPIQPISISKLLGIEAGAIHLREKPFTFSIIIYNMALLVSPAPYKGTNREKAIEELIKRIAASRPDVVGLCEVFADGEREKIRTDLSGHYPDYREGPDEADLDSDGGLLILSKHRINKSHQIIFRQCAGADCWANKGVIHIQIQPAGSPMPLDIFFSHTQNIAENGGKAALYSQLTKIGNMVTAFADFHTPTFIMGDLNIPAGNLANYQTLIKNLGNPIDLWITKHPGTDGFTFARSNFYEDPDDSPDINGQQRLDYILMKSGQNYIPVPKQIDILKWSQGGRQISDHFGLRVEFEQLLEAKVS